MLDDMSACVCVECGTVYRSLTAHLRENPDCCPPALLDGESSSDESDDESMSLSARVSQDMTREWVAAALADLRHENGLGESGLEGLPAELEYLRQN